MGTHHTLASNLTKHEKIIENCSEFEPNVLISENVLDNMPSCVGMLVDVHCFASSNQPIGNNLQTKMLIGWKHSQGTKDTKVKILFQGLHMTSVSILCWFTTLKFVFWVPH